MKISEHQLQVQIVNYLRVRHIFCFAVSNGFYGGKDRVKAAKHVNKLKSEGFMVGAADLVVLLPRAKTVFLELKVGSNGQQPSQLLFQKNVEELGFKYHVVKSLEDVKQVLGLS
jgi:hypothetical protein